MEGMTKPIRPLPPLATLSAAKLHALIARLQAEASDVNTRAIEAGMGHMRYSETEALARQNLATPQGLLAVEYIARSERYSAARAELARRYAWHGSDKPIKSANPSRSSSPPPTGRRS